MQLLLGMHTPSPKMPTCKHNWKGVALNIHLVERIFPQRMIAGEDDLFAEMKKYQYS
jgi:hypothetical protein